MAFSKLLLSNLVLLSISAVLGLPSSDTAAELSARASEIPDGPALVTFCRGTLSPPQGCASYTMTLGACVDLSGDKIQYFKALRSVKVPDGFTCSLHDKFNCVISANPSSTVVLQSGEYDLEIERVPNNDGRPIDFNRLAGSYRCILAV